ncbi:MAG TPA: hypothetical protein VGD65_09040 [Chryseosolibacter sp.]
MKLALILLIAFSLVQEIPVKPKEEFEIKLDYQFKNRPAQDLNSVHLDETRKEHDRRVSTAPLPFLTLNIKMLKLSDEEVKLRVTNNLTPRVAVRKVEEGTIVPLQIGFTDDVKDRVTAHHYTLTLLSPKKTETSRIEILIEEDGTFLVNGEKRGKF